MTEKRFNRSHEMRVGQIGITDELHDSGDEMFPKNLTEDETVHLLNKFNEQNERLWEDVEESCLELTKINLKMIEISKRDLTDVERIFLKNICKELELPVFCCMDEDKFCDDCHTCIDLQSEYYADIMSGINEL